MTFALLNLLRSAPGSAAVATDNKSRTSGRRAIFKKGSIQRESYLFCTPHLPRRQPTRGPLALKKKTEILTG